MSQFRCGEKKVPLTDEDRAIWDWQIATEDLGEAGQERLKGASVLVSRCGGLGSVVAYELAAAGVGTLVLAHAGNLQPSDLNRQLLMTHDWLGKPRIESVRRRLLDLNPRLNLVTYNANLSEENISEEKINEIVAQADLVVDCAPLFTERYAMNRAAFQQGKPIVECAMYDMEYQITTMIPGETPCLRCLYPEDPSGWKRKFPVFGAVSGTVGCLGAVEAIKLITDIGDPLTNRLLCADLRRGTHGEIAIHRRPDCPVCRSL
ncbi:MAG: HesA/MoeB/ThiF family protein [Planctomycetes bacterium]|nr:HesA/MoeB/ThiF family protein [Planctomycetota bacterium]